MQERHLSSVAAVKMHDNWLIMCNIEILDGRKETSVSIYVPDDSDKLSARANDGRESEVNIKPNLVWKKKCFRQNLSQGKMIFFLMEMLVIYYTRLFPTFSQAPSRSHLISVTHKCNTDPAAARTRKTTAF